MMTTGKNNRFGFRAIAFISIMAVSPIFLSATETISPDTDTINVASPANFAIAEILEPDFIDFSIDYTWSTKYDYNGNQTMTGRLVMQTGTPTFTIGGATRFTDGTIATQTFTVSFQGVWQLAGVADFHNWPGQVYTGEAFHVDSGTVTFGLTEDTGDGVYWRLISGSFPGASISYPDHGGDILVGGKIVLWRNNDLDYNYFAGDEDVYSHVSQTLSKSRYSSPYPALSFVSHYVNSYVYFGAEETYTYSCAFVMHSGPSENTNQE